ncbi:unannotated protein [freshwater metagenome]|uniref:Unannotated protein n=1 Tax=freshwater metagenome TaxID=449393 RepID=A0A6J7J4C8_9ZZZZ
MLTRVSIVDVPCFRLVHAARWNGSAPQTTTGAARVNDSHCQLVNWRAGIMAIAMTGMLSTAETTNRCFSGSVGRSSCGSAAGSVAVYPAASTAAIRSSVATPSLVTRAFSVA